MPNKTDPAKHRTPNFRLISHRQTYTDVYGSPRTRVLSRWEAMPLRKGRKDLP